MADFLQKWTGTFDCLQSEEFQEIMTLFENNSYLKELKVLGENESSQSPDETLKLDVGYINEARDYAKTVSLKQIDKAPPLKRKKDQVEASVQDKEPAKKQTVPIASVSNVGEDGEDAKKKRQIHNATERRRREKINDHIEELKKLLPGEGKGINKMGVLEQTAERIHTLQNLIQKAINERKKIEDSQNELREEIYRLRSIIANHQCRRETAPATPVMNNNNNFTSSQPPTEHFPEQNTRDYPVMNNVNLAMNQNLHALTNFSYGKPPSIPYSMAQNLNPTAQTNVHVHVGNSLGQPQLPFNERAFHF